MTIGSICIRPCSCQKCDVLVQADKHAVVSLPMFCRQQPFCQIAARVTADSSYNSCWELLRQMLHPQQDKRAAIADVMNSMFITAA